MGSEYITDSGVYKVRLYPGWLMSERLKMRKRLCVNGDLMAIWTSFSPKAVFPPGVLCPYTLQVAVP